MRVGNDVFKEDMKRICFSTVIPWENLVGKHVLVTGATGLLGYSLINSLLFYGSIHNVPLYIYAVARNKEKFEKKYERQIKDYSNLFFIESDVRSNLDIKDNIDYIIHAASETRSQSFIEQPVETIETAVYGTKNLLELAREKKVKGFLYLSTMEVYGYPSKGHKVKESDVCSIEPLRIRNSYPMGKLMCENLCCAYMQEYEIPVKILRLTQTFGPGIDYDDKRVFAEFARCAVEHRTIVLHTEGKTSRSYLYTADAVTAMLITLLKGKNGQAYNVANEKTYCTIREMAEIVAQIGNLKVEIEKTDITAFGYADTLYMDLDTSLLEGLGWKANYGLKEMYERMIEGMGVK